MIKEVTIQTNFIEEGIETIYLGGGTPSLLKPDQISALLNAAYNNFKVASEPEVTMECNPEDLNAIYLAEIKAIGINRLSIGIQSLYDDELSFMNRPHDSKQALLSIAQAREAGFTNISLDLIFGIPGSTLSRVKSNLEELLENPPEHLSTYGLTIEPNTVFGNWVRKGKIKETEEEASAVQYEEIARVLKLAGFKHYEISNFAKPGFESRHNSNYWKGKPYLGIGPGAHSYNGNRRQFNVRNNKKYIDALTSNELCMDFEDLSDAQKLNEYIMTSLRTQWGCDMKIIMERFDLDLYMENKNYIDKLVTENYLELDNECLILSDKGKLIADSITEKLFLDED